jgi:hypothetical protein
MRRGRRAASGGGGGTVPPVRPSATRRTSLGSLRGEALVPWNEGRRTVGGLDPNIWLALASIDQSTDRVGLGLDQWASPATQLNGLAQYTRWQPVDPNI